MSVIICEPSGMTNNKPAGSSSLRFVKYLSGLLAATDLTTTSRSPVFPLTTSLKIIEKLAATPDVEPAEFLRRHKPYRKVC